MTDLPIVKYSGKIREVKIGKPGVEMVVGGATVYSFHMFEGSNPNPPKLGLQVLDIPPEEWAPAALAPFEDVSHDSAAWARKCVDEYGADFVCLWLMGTDPNGKDLSAEHAAEVAKKVGEAISVPLIVWGVSNDEKNVETLKAVCELCDGMNIAVGPITENNYKQIGAAALAYKHVVVANSPIDINLAKQLNILLETLGMPEDRIIIDPTTSGVGYGMEYCYSIMERIRQAALCQNDDKLQYPMLSNIAEEVWKLKEAKLQEDQEPKLGAAETRGINLETITAVSVLNAGSDMLILRHPETLKHVRAYISSMMLETDLESMDVDLSLTVESKPEPSAAKKAIAAKKPKAAKKPAVAKKPAAAKAKAVEEAKAIGKKAEEPSKAAELAVPPKEKRVEEPKPRPDIGEPRVRKVVEIPSEKPKPFPRVKLSLFEEDLLEDAFAAKFQEMNLPSTEINRLLTALWVLRMVQRLEKQVTDAEQRGIPVGEIDFSSDEISSYRDVQSLGTALHTVATILERAQDTGSGLEELDLSDVVIKDLRSGLDVLREKRLIVARRFGILDLPAPKEDATTEAISIQLQVMNLSDTEIDRLHKALSVMRKIQNLEKKVTEAERAGASLESIDFSDDEISAYREVQSLAKALRIIELKNEEAERSDKPFDEVDFTAPDLDDLRSGLALFEQKRIEVAAPIEERVLEHINLQDDDLEVLQQMLGLFRSAKRVVQGLLKLSRGEAA